MSSLKAPLVSSITEAAVAVIVREDGWLLLNQRPSGKPWAGYWEFPGGKIEAGETAETALKRELAEELGIVPTAYYPWLVRTFDYVAKYDATGRLESPAKTVKLHFFVVDQWAGTPVGLEQQTIVWQNPLQVSVTPLLPANAPIFSAWNLPRMYALTYLAGLGEKAFFARLENALEQGLRMIQVREKQLSREALQGFLARVMTAAKPFNAQVIVHSDVLMARQLRAAGVHFSAQALLQLEQKPEGLICGASCHNPQELMRAQALALDYVSLSPVQATLSHAEAPPLGWAGFETLIKNYTLPVYALGGMSVLDLATARLHGAHGIAMQRSIWL